MLKLFDQYVHGFIDRRVHFTIRAVRGRRVTGTMLLDMLNPRFAKRSRSNRTTHASWAKYVEYFSAQGSGRMKGYR